MRRLPALLLVVVAAFGTAPAAHAAPKPRTRVAVELVNRAGAPVAAWRVTATLRAGAALRGATGARAVRRGRALTLRQPRRARALPPGGRRTAVVRLRGRAPRGWVASTGTAPARSCTVVRDAVVRRRHRPAVRVVAVRCTLRAAGSGVAGDTGSGGPAPGPTPGPGGGTGTGSTPAPGAGPEFAPYIDFVAYPRAQLAAIRAASGADALTLGFVTARKDQDCVPTWGGYAEYPAAGAAPDQLDQVRAAGDGRIVSFGGAAGKELARVCPTAAALADAYRSVLTAYGARRADFDVEGDATMADTAATARRNAALAVLSREGIQVSYTLAVNPTGLEPAGRALLQGARDAGFTPAVVNVMAMDYGDQAAPSPAGRMGDYAIQAAQATLGQLQAIFPGATAAMVGVTPMIGINDVPSEVFGVADAAKLRTWAAGAGVGRLAMWQLARDHRCPAPSATTQETCSGVDQADWAFSRAFLGR